jgi:hypothetical protein
MSSHLRDDKECQNCGYTVEEIYCPRCGQKNTETRQPFSHLAAHFIEDFTHYDGAFWKTIKYLMLRPAKLTQEYLHGKRQAFVPPVKLYIFISFITFFIPATLPDVNTEDTVHEIEQTYQEIEPVKEVSVEEKMNTKAKVWITGFTINGDKLSFENPLYYPSLQEMDSIENLKPQHLRLSNFEKKLGKKIINLYKHKTPQEVGTQFGQQFYNSIPKTLFIYLPVFAFWLWLLHGKKRWLFFDHGIFTLHYFSFLLLINVLLILLYKIAYSIDTEFTEAAYIVTFFTLLAWQVYYFYRAHRKMYHESWIVNFLKSSLLFLVNLFCILFIAMCLTYITFYSLH